MSTYLENIKSSEWAVIGLLTLNHELFDEIQLSLDHFIETIPRKYFQIMQKLHSKNQVWDKIIISDSFDFDPETQEKVSKELNELTDSPSHLSQFHEYVSVLETKYLHRQIQNLYQRGNVDPFELDELIKIYQETAHTKSFQNLSDIAKNTEIEMINVQSGEIDLPIGLSDMNIKMSGFKRGDMFVIAGQPGHSKSNLLYNAILGPLRAGKKVLDIEYEMSPSSVLKRLTSIELKVPLNFMTHGRTVTGKRLSKSQQEWTIKSIRHMSQKYKNSLIITENLSISDIRKMVLSTHPDIVTIDYIQLFAEKQKMSQNDKMHSHLSRLCNQLKLMASEFNFALVVTSQVNRENIADVPTMRQMKDSSGIEQCAAVIVAVLDPFKVTGNLSDKGSYKIAIRKNRHGPTWRDDNMFINHDYGVISESDLSLGDLEGEI